MDIVCLLILDGYLILWFLPIIYRFLSDLKNTSIEIYYFILYSLHLFIEKFMSILTKYILPLLSLLFFVYFAYGGVLEYSFITILFPYLKLVYYIIIILLIWTNNILSKLFVREFLFMKSLHVILTSTIITC